MRKNAKQWQNLFAEWGATSLFLVCALVTFLIWFEFRHTLWNDSRGLSARALERFSWVIGAFGLVTILAIFSVFCIHLWEGYKGRHFLNPLKFPTGNAWKWVRLNLLIFISLLVIPFVLYLWNVNYNLYHSLNISLVTFAIIIGLVSVKRTEQAWFLPRLICIFFLTFYFLEAFARVKIISHAPP